MWGEDKWADKSAFTCQTCMFFVARGIVGRCRRRAPSIQGWPVVHPSDWCGDHKIDEDKLYEVSKKDKDPSTPKTQRLI